MRVKNPIDFKSYEHKFSNNAQKWLAHLIKLKKLYIKLIQIFRMPRKGS